MISYLIRIATIFIPCNILELTIMNRCFYRNKPIIPLICMWLIRSFFIMPLYLPSGMASEAFLNSCMLVQLFMVPIQNLTFIWTFHNERTSVAKILAIGLICDGIASLVIALVTLVVNFISGYPVTSTGFAYPFKITDLVSPLMMIFVFFPLLKKSEPALKLITDYQIKHPVIVSCVLIPVYLMGYITSIKPLELNAFLYYTITAAMIAIISISIGTYMYAINNQRKALRASNQMVNDHYQMLQSRIDELERQQNEINAKMTVLVSANFPEDLTTRYLNDMKHLKDNLYTTLYTHYYMIDAVLSAKAKDYREHQISFECQCEGLSLNHLSQVQIAQVLMTLFRTIDQYDNTSVKLKLSSYMNQVLIVLETSETIGIRHLKRQLSNQLSSKLLSIQKKKQTLYLSLTD